MFSIENVIQRVEAANELPPGTIKIIKKKDRKGKKNNEHAGEDSAIHQRDK